MPAGTDTKNVEIWFQDEARVGQHGTITRLWAEKGTRPRAVRQMQYKFSYIFGAVCPSRNASVGLIIDEVGIDAMTAIYKWYQSKSRQVKLPLLFWIEPLGINQKN